MGKIEDVLEIRFKQELVEAIRDKEKEMNLIRLDELREQKNDFLEQQKNLKKQMKQTFNREVHNLQKDYSSKIDEINDNKGELVDGFTQVNAEEIRKAYTKGSGGNSRSVKNGVSNGKKKLVKRKQVVKNKLETVDQEANLRVC